MRLALAALGIMALIVVLAFAGSKIWNIASSHHDTASSGTTVVPATCIAYYQDVTIMLVGVPGTGMNEHGCVMVIQPMVNHVGGVWTSQTTQPGGEQFARLSSGAMTVRIYDKGDSDKPLAGKVANWFQAAGWHPEVPD